MTMSSSVLARALTIAGSDSGGGAGIQADLKTFTAFGVYGMSVLTAITAQNTVGVQGVETLTPAFITTQFESVVSDIGVDALKTGMLGTAAVVTAVAAMIARGRVDEPRRGPRDGREERRSSAGGGRRRCAAHRLLLPLALVITPNVPEAETLVGGPIRTPERCARRRGGFTRSARAGSSSRAGTWVAKRSPTCSSTARRSNRSTRRASTRRTPTAPAAPSPPR